MKRSRVVWSSSAGPALFGYPPRRPGRLRRAVRTVMVLAVYSTPAERRDPEAILGQYPDGEATAEAARWYRCELFMPPAASSRP